jgi:hemerythrin superfamily protein
MPTAHSENRSSKSSGVTQSGRASMQPDDGVSMLMRDHREVEDLFKAFKAAKEDTAKKQEICRQIVQELKLHTQIEEEIFYPSSREFLKDDSIVNESVVEHQSVKQLMAELEGMDPADPYFDARMKVMREMVNHHVEEEETNLFPKCRRSDMDLAEIGERMKARKAELKGGKTDGRGRH